MWINSFLVVFFGIFGMCSLSSAPTVCCETLNNKLENVGWCISIENWNHIPKCEQIHSNGHLINPNEFHGVFLFEITFANLHFHIFTQCPMSIMQWTKLNFSWNEMEKSFELNFTLDQIHTEEQPESTLQKVEKPLRILQ